MIFPVKNSSFKNTASTQDSIFYYLQGSEKCASVSFMDRAKKVQTYNILK